MRYETKETAEKDTKNNGKKKLEIQKKKNRKNKQKDGQEKRQKINKKVDGRMTEKKDAGIKTQKKRD